MATSRHGDRSEDVNAEMQNVEMQNAEINGKRGHRKLQDCMISEDARNS